MRKRGANVAAALLLYWLDVACLASTPEDLDAFFDGSYREAAAPSLATPVTETAPPKTRSDDTWAAANVESANGNILRV